MRISRCVSAATLSALQAIAARTCVTQIKDAVVPHAFGNVRWGSWHPGVIFGFSTS
jgi:hypothetical protein